MRLRKSKFRSLLYWVILDKLYNHCKMGKLYSILGLLVGENKSNI